MMYLQQQAQRHAQALAAWSNSACQSDDLKNMGQLLLHKPRAGSTLSAYKFMFREQSHVHRVDMHMTKLIGQSDLPLVDMNRLRPFLQGEYAHASRALGRRIADIRAMGAEQAARAQVDVPRGEDDDRYDFGMQP